MEKIIRLEIVTAALDIPRLCARLREVGIVNFTVMRGVQGHGERGRQEGDDVAGVSENGYLLTTCPHEQLPHAIEAIRPFLRESGGECLISEATRIRH